MLKSAFKKRHPQVGARPGTLVIPQGSPTPRIHLINYSDADLTEVDVDDVQQLKAAFNEDSVTWVDVQGFGDETVIQKIGDLFELHPLLLADVVNVPQRPKAEVYGDQLLLIVRMIHHETNGEVNTEQVGIVLAENYVLTFQEAHGDVLDPIRLRLRSGIGRLRKQRADYLAYAIADTIVDAYYPVLESIGDRLEEFAEQVIHHPTSELLKQLNRMKMRLVSLRRATSSQRDAMSHLMSGQLSAISEDALVYFRDTHDHCVQTSEVADMYREIATELVNMYLSSVANRTNDVMKVLTIMASIFIPLTFLAGIYGMNFEYMPELHVKWAYPTVWATMIATATGMLWFFWRKGWLVGSSPSTKDG